MSESVLVGRARVEVNPVVPQGAGAALGQQITGSANGTQVGQQIGQQVGQGVAASGTAAGESFGEKLKGGLNKASAGIVVAGGAAVAGLIAVGDTFDGLSDTIRAGTGATGAALDNLMADAREVAKVTPASFEQIAPVVADLNTRLGLTGTTLQTVTSQVLEAGRVMGTELDISTITAGLSAFGIAGEDVSGALDSVFQASQASGVGMNELAAAASSSAPAMKALGFSFEDTVALTGKLQKAGIDAGGVMGGMGKALINLAKAGEQPQEAFQRSVKEIQSMMAAGDELGARDLAGQIFGTKGSTNFINALQSGKLNVDDLQAGLGATSDTILGVGEDTADFAEKWQVFTNKTLIALEPLATKVFGLVGEALDTVTPKLEAAFTWIGDNIETVKTIGLVVGGFAAGILVLNAALTAYTVIAGTVQAVTSIWTGVQWLLNTAILANPITWLVIGVAALVAGVIIAYQNIGWFKDGVNAAWEAITGAIGGGLSWITGTALPAMGAFFGAIWNGAAGMGQKLGEVFGSIGGAIGSAIGGAMGFARDAFNNVVNFFVGAGERIGGVFSSIGSFIGDTFKNITGTIRGIVNNLINIINAPIRAINGLRVNVPGWVPVIGGKSWAPNLTPIANFAQGGTVRASPGGSVIRVSENKKDETILDTASLQRHTRAVDKLAQNTDKTSAGNNIRNDITVNGANFDARDAGAELFRLQKWDN